MKEVKEQQKETPVKEMKEIKDIVVQQLSSKEPKKTKKKNDILAQIGEKYSIFFSRISVHAYLHSLE